jgi:two-component system chemotaxis response regulator CheY
MNSNDSTDATNANRHPDAIRTFVLVGHCGPDMFMLRSAVGRLMPGVKIELANDQKSLAAHLHSGAVLLVNRMLDGEFHTSSGVDLIAQINESDEAPITMLVSNFPDAQEAAVAAGARPGFGKSALYDDATAERIRSAASD